jgi:hypothetical protein
MSEAASAADSWGNGRRLSPPRKGQKHTVSAKEQRAIAGVIEGWLKTLPAKPAGHSAQR